VAEPVTEIVLSTAAACVGISADAASAAVIARTAKDRRAAPI
jgi:hypothetical protein